MNCPPEQKSNLSKALVWELTKRNNCFLKKIKSGKKGYFLCDPHNISCKNTPSSSGLVKNDGMNLRFKKGKVVLCVKSTEKNVVTNKEYKARNFKKTEKLIEDNGKLEKNKSKKRLLKKYKRMSKLYNCSNKANK
ncbi:60S ribosomal protein L28, putative [Plasmodium malariae]|uniref:60S ribosomal protein L28, putative n=1 Tax=Plasmodium malariae TaxID=5858 RepID=A0A1C3KD35_PLAMA|nr:60S ribosomal protein L28, putative [Plasmodium malariae]